MMPSTNILFVSGETIDKIWIVNAKINQLNVSVNFDLNIAIPHFARDKNVNDITNASINVISIRQDRHASK